MKPMPEESCRRILLDREEVLNRRRRYWVLRRIQDVLLSAAALLVLWPALLIIALVIVLDSPGASPVFVQERAGRDGRLFRCYKFRSMIPNAERELEALLGSNEADGPVFKIRSDPRITRVGRFLRRSSLDELPQLINVLRGEMSIVGPRPPLPREVAEYDEYQRQRLYVTPGLPCYWQILPQRNTASFDKWMELDMRYISSSSFWEDWVIILKTFGAIFRMNGV